jgi:hypothetical protein
MRAVAPGVAITCWLAVNPAMAGSDTPSSSADHPAAGWRIALWSAIGVGAAGLATFAVGHRDIADAEDELCAIGAPTYARGAGCGVHTGTAADITRANAQGERGQTLTRVGLVTVGLAVGAAALAAYEAYGAHRHERPLAIVPVVAPGTGGAAMTWRW